MYHDQFKMRYLLTRYWRHPRLYKLKDHLIYSNKLKNFFFNHGFISLVIAGIFSTLLAMALLAGSHHAYYIPADLTGIGILVGAIGYIYTSTKDRIAADEDSVRKALIEIMEVTKDISTMEIMFDMELTISNSIISRLNESPILNDEIRKKIVSIITKQYTVACSIVNRRYINIGRKIILTNDPIAIQERLCKKPENRFSMFLSFKPDSSEVNAGKKYPNNHKIIYVRLRKLTALQDYIFCKELSKKEACKLYDLGLLKNWHLGHTITTEENPELVAELSDICKLNDKGWEVPYDYITALFKYSRLAEYHLLSSTRYGDRDLEFTTNSSGEIEQMPDAEKKHTKIKAEQRNIKAALAYLYGFVALMETLTYALATYLPDRNQKSLQKDLFYGLEYAEEICLYFLEECALPILFLNLSNIHRMTGPEETAWRKEGIKFFIIQINPLVQIPTIPMIIAEAEKILDKDAINYAYIEIRSLGLSQFWYFEPETAPRRLANDHMIDGQRLVNTRGIKFSQCRSGISAGWQISESSYKLSKESLEYITEITGHIHIVRCSSREKLGKKSLSIQPYLHDEHLIVPLQPPSTPPFIFTSSVAHYRPLPTAPLTPPLPFPQLSPPYFHSLPLRPDIIMAQRGATDVNGHMLVQDHFYDGRVYVPIPSEVPPRRRYLGQRSRSR